MKSHFSLLHDLKKNTETLNKIEESIKIILGPTGRIGITSNLNGTLVFLTNGSSLLNSIQFSTFSENILLKLIEQAAKKTFAIAGDGSSLTTLLTCHILTMSLPFLISGYNAIFLSNGLKKLSYYLNEKIIEFSYPILSLKQLIAVMQTALGKKVKKDVFQLLEKTIDQITRDGLILVEENILPKNELETVQGIELDKGFASSYFVNNLSTFEVIYENAFLLISSQPLNSLTQIQEIINYCKEKNRPLVIIIEEIQKDILSTLVLNNLKKKLKIVVIKYSSIKFLKNGILEDLALLTHANYVTNDISDTKNSTFVVENLGKIRKVIINKEKSTFLVSKFSKLMINRRINELNRELILSESEYEKNIFKTRIARLSGNILKMKLALSNQYELNEMRQKIENSVITLKATLEEGFLPGGGSFFVYLSQNLFVWSSLNLIGEEIFAGQILEKVLLKPQAELLSNISKKEEKEKIQIELQKLSYPYAYHLIEQKIVNTLESSNVADSTKAIRGSLWNAITMSATIITT